MFKKKEKKQEPKDPISIWIDEVSNGYNVQEKYYASDNPSVKYVAKTKEEVIVIIKKILGLDENKITGGKKDD